MKYRAASWKFVQQEYVAFGPSFDTAEEAARYANTIRKEYDHDISQYKVVRA